MKLIEIFKKQGGIKLINQYWKSGVLFTAIGEFLLLGKSRTSLEILRLSTQLKVKQKLEKKYKKVIEKLDGSYDTSLTHTISKKVWICWFQGIENAPILVQKCYHSVLNNLSDREVVLITKDNMNDYITFPDYIIDKWNNGIITNTHLTDLLRLELLTKYGGLWLDATVLCTNPSEEIPDYFFDSDLFFFQCLKPGRDGHSTYISSWLMSAKTNNKILMITKELCYEYWRKNNSMCDYFLLHDFLSIVLDKYENEWRNIVPKDNSTPHILLLNLFEEYEAKRYGDIINQCCFHKLSYKFSDSQVSKRNTVYKHIIDSNGVNYD